jgi:hypothetical protein
LSVSSFWQLPLLPGSSFGKGHGFGCHARWVNNFLSGAK